MRVLAALAMVFVATSSFGAERLILAVELDHSDAYRQIWKMNTEVPVTEGIQMVFQSDKDPETGGHGFLKVTPELQEDGTVEVRVRYVQAKESHRQRMSDSIVRMELGTSSTVQTSSMEGDHLKVKVTVSRP